MDHKGRTPLYKACLESPDLKVSPTQEKHKSVEMLIAGGADPTISNTDSLPIHIAVKLGEIK